MFKRYNFSNNLNKCKITLNLLNTSVTIGLEMYITTFEFERYLQDVCEIKKQ